MQQRNFYRILFIGLLLFVTTFNVLGQTSTAPDSSGSEKKKSKKKKDEVFNPYQDSKIEKPVIEQTPEQIAGMLLDTGNYYLDRAMYKQAEIYFDSIIKFYPKSFQHTVAYYFRGKCRMGTGDEQEAMADFKNFLFFDKCKSNFCTDTHYNIGILKFRAGEPVEAMEEFTTALDDTTYKNRKYCYFYMAFCFAQKEDFVHAVQNLTTFLSFDKQRTYSSAEALYYRGYYKAQLKDNRGALKDYDEAVQLYQSALDSKNPNQQHVQKLIDTYIVRGLAKAELKRYDDAIADYDQVLKINPKYAMAYRLKGLSEIGKGLTDQGCLTLSKAGELGSDEAYEDIKAHCK